MVYSCHENMHSLSFLCNGAKNSRITLAHGASDSKIARYASILRIIFILFAFCFAFLLHLPGDGKACVSSF